MPDATKLEWLVEYVDADERIVYARYETINGAIPFLHKVLSEGKRPRLYRETPITLTIDVGGEAPIKSPRRRRKKEAKEGAASPQAAVRDGLSDGLAGESARGVAPHSLSPQPTAEPTASPVFPWTCEARFDGDPMCPGPTAWDSVTGGVFCGLHALIPESNRRELHRKHKHRNRPVRVAHAG